MWGVRAASTCCRTSSKGASLKVEQEQRRYTESEVLALMSELLDVLAYLHRLSPPVIHRDIKPANIMRRPDGSLALIDFGSVRDVIRDAQTGGSTVAGTFGFMAPEQFAGEATPATDIYGLGATAIALLSRQDPATLHQRSGQFEWQQAVSLSPAARDLLAEMVSLDPAQRPVDTRALQARIQGIKSGRIQAPRSAPRPAVASRPTGARLAEPATVDDLDGLDDLDQPLTHASHGAPARSRGSAAMVMVMGAVLAIGAIAAMALVFVVRPEPMPPPVDIPAVVAPAVETPVLEQRHTVTTDDFTVTKRVSPSFPDSMKDSAESSTTCTISVFINPDGTVNRSGLGSGSCNDDFLDSADEALQRWEFALRSDLPAVDVYVYKLKLTWKLKGPG